MYFGGGIKAHDSGPKAGLVLAEKLLQLTRHRSHDPATRLMRNIYLCHAKSLICDTNFTCQTTCLLAGGVSPVIDQIEPVLRAGGQRLLDEVLAASAHVIPEWSCDGIHCIGNDVRYAGMWDRMYAVCQQFNCH